MSPDPRLALVRDGLAAAALDGVIAADRYAATEPMSVVAASATLRSGPSSEAEQKDQLLFGEAFDRLETCDGWIFGQARRDGYVGWVPAAELGPRLPAPTHRVGALRTYALAEADVKSSGWGPLPLNALVRVEAEVDGFAQVAGAGWVRAGHLAPIGLFEADPVAVALRQLGAPYLWGGRDGLGLDCSGLVQQALFACGRGCPRDSDQQMALGRPVEREALQRGDLVFWKGHVAFMTAEAEIVHASGRHMAVVTEPLDAACAHRGEPIGYRRLERL